MLDRIQNEVFLGGVGSCVYDRKSEWKIVVVWTRSQEIDGGTGEESRKHKGREG